MVTDRTSSGMKYRSSHSIRLVHKKRPPHPAEVVFLISYRYRLDYTSYSRIVRWLSICLIVSITTETTMRSEVPPITSVWVPVNR